METFSAAHRHSDESETKPHEGVLKMEHPGIKIINEPKNIDAVNPMGGLGGGGAVAGGLGGLLLGALLGGNSNGGLLGGRNNDAGGALAVEAVMNANQIGDLKYEVAATASATQAQAAAGNANIINTITQQTLVGQQAFASQNQALCQGLNAINTNLLTGLADVNSNTTSEAEKTRALITAQYSETLNRQLTECNATRLAEQTQAAILAASNERRRESEAVHAQILINNSATAAATSTSTSMQIQQINGLVNEMYGMHTRSIDLANATARNVTNIVGNRGVTSARQEANPTSVNS